MRPAALGDTWSWTQLNERDLSVVEQPVLPARFWFRAADGAGPKAVAGQATSAKAARGAGGSRWRSGFGGIVGHADMGVTMTTYAQGFSAQEVDISE